MYLKKINIVGFKTFPNKVNVELIKGINAFVGPNGCGKSNLVDAIRWGLGEQNPYNLRGTRMEDIIFVGTNNRKPLGMAEVTLTLDNQDSHSSTFSEISITRRLFRSGESEYLINRTPVRLKDIQEIFAGTGLGAPGYSFLSQDMVEFVILSKPRERRLLFEEVAGISQFKSEKQKILRNIEKARENLIRVQDITGEMERQLKYIKRQASKARKFRDLAEKVKDVEITLAAGEYQKLEKEKKEIRKSISQLKEREILLERAVQERESRRKELERALEEIEDKLEQVREKETIIRENIIRVEGKLNLFQEKKYQLEKSKENSRRRAENLEEEFRATLNNIAALQKREERGKIELKEYERKSALLNERIREFSGERVKWEQVREKLRERNFEVAANIARISNEINKLSRDIHNAEVKIFKIEKEIKNYQAQKESLNEKLTNLKKDLAGKEQLAKALQKETTALENLLQKESREIDAFRDNLQEKIDIKKALAAKISLWEEILKGDSQIPSGNRYLKTKYPHLSFMGDLVEVETGALKAFESLFVHLVDALWVDNWKEAKQLLEEAKREKKGRVKLIIGKKHAVKYWQGKMKGPEIISKFLPPEEKTSWVNNLSEAEEYIKKGNFSEVLITREGEVIYPNGLITAVYDEKSIVTGREKRFRAMTDRLKETEKEIREWQEKVAKKTALLSELKDRLNSKLREQSQVEKEIEEWKEKQRQLTQREKDIENALQALNSEKKEWEKEIEDSKKALKEMEKTKEKEEIKKNLVGDELKEAGKNIDNIAQEVFKLREEMQDTVQKISHWKVNLENVKINLSELKKRKEKLGRDKVQGQMEEDKYADEMQGITKAIKELEEERGKNEKELQEIRRESSKLLQMKEEKEKERRNEEERSRRMREEWEQTLHQLQEKELSFTRIEGEMRNIYSRIYSLYQVEIDRWKDKNLSIIEEDLDYLRDRLKRLGEVNLTAIEEENEIEERYQFYLNQKEDIEKSIDELRSTLKHLEKEAKRRFLDVFEEIRREFSRTFQEIFAGGEADLKLTEEENFEEKGVEIMASPPGKKPSHLSLLSQGERALVAISLLFSFFRIKPSPFCMLDEIDAPLDDPNVSKLLNFLKRLKDNTQFLIISHNKRTLSEADALFGITMEEPGISKILSVNFMEAAEISEN